MDEVATTVEEAKAQAVAEFFGPTAEWTECDCDGEGHGCCLPLVALVDCLPGFTANGAGLGFITFRAAVR